MVEEVVVVVGGAFRRARAVMSSFCGEGRLVCWDEIRGAPLRV